MSNYKATLPKANTQVSPQIQSFFETFYAVSDDPSESAHAKYVDSLTPDGTLMMGTRKATGATELRALREGLWSGPVKTRKHTVYKIFAFSENEVMVYGDVQYGLNNGKDVAVEWAARAVFVEFGGALRMKDYQVYLDSAPVANAMKD